MVNRYTNLTPAKFNPLSLNEIMLVPLGRQQQHDQAQARLDNLGTFDVNRLQVDDELISGRISDLQKRTDGLTDQLLDKGVSKGLTKQLLQIKRDRDKFLSNDGQGGQAQAAFNAYQANVKEAFGNKKLDSAQRDAGLRYALSQYSGIENNGRFNPYRGADAVNIQERGLEIAKNLSPQEIAVTTGWQRNNDGTWTKGNTTTEKLPAEVIRKAVVQTLQNDTEVNNYLRDLNKIGLLDDPVAHLNNAAINAGNLFQVNNFEQDEDLKFEPAHLSSLGSGINSDGLNFNRILPPEAELNEVGDLSKNTLNKILRGDKHSIPTRPAFDKFTKQHTRDLYADLVKKGGKLVSIEDFTPEETERYNNLAQGLFKAGRVNSTDLKDSKVLSAISEYENKFKNYQYGIDIISDTSGGIGNYSSGTISKDTNAVLNQAKADKFNQLFMHPETGEQYTWKELQEEFDVEDISLIQGYVDVDNNLPSKVSKEYESRKSEFVSPQVITLKDKDGKQLPNFYMTRNDGQLRTPRYRADIKLNDIFSTLRELPEIPQDIKLGDRDFEASYLPAESLDEIIATTGNTILNENRDGFKANANADQIVYYRQLLEAKSKIESGQGLFKLTAPNIKGLEGFANFKTKSEIQEFMYKIEGVSGF